MIQVTQEHIEKGQRFEPFSCAVALALKDSGFESARVSESEIVCDCDIFPVPSSVRAFVGRFDRGEPVLPFSFELDERMGVIP